MEGKEADQTERMMQQQQQDDADVNANDTVTENDNDGDIHTTRGRDTTNADSTTNTKEDNPNANNNAKRSSVPSAVIPVPQSSILNEEQQRGMREALARIQQLSLGQPQQPPSFVPSPSTKAFTTLGEKLEVTMGHGATYRVPTTAPFARRSKYHQ